MCRHGRRKDPLECNQPHSNLAFVGLLRFKSFQRSSRVHYRFFLLSTVSASKSECIDPDVANVTTSSRVRFHCFVKRSVNESSNYFIRRKENLIGRTLPTECLHSIRSLLPSSFLSKINRSESEQRVGKCVSIGYVVHFYFFFLRVCLIVVLLCFLNFITNISFKHVDGKILIV